MEHTGKVETANQHLESERNSYKTQIEQWSAEMADLKKKQTMF
jgi:hypothetical protein